ncbi:MAG: DNA phosphorothioation-dependent restriction protein DptG [Erysipelotrichaceae bacterium]|nr:DNA phosphorothioation-dependent restriction protein DptG [Erysipelotrichaceae bacterium]
MTYRASIDKFQNSRMVKSNNSIGNNTGYSIGVLPFNTSTHQDYDMKNAVKAYLTKVNQKKLAVLGPDQLISEIEQDEGLVSGIEKEEARRMFEQIIKVMFYEGQELRVKNLKTMMTDTHATNNDKRIARFLKDVLGNQETLKKTMSQKGINNDSSDDENLNPTENAFEKLVFSKMKFEDLPPKDEDKSDFFQVLNWLAPSFEKDFNFIVSDTERTKDYLIQVVEFYCFTYLSYLILTLNDFFGGKRNQYRQLFYALEWEKTTRSRDCYNLGWKQVEHGLDSLFSHAIVLELLNFKDGEKESVDYIKLNEIIEAHKDEDEEIAESIRAISDLYGQLVAGSDSKHQKAIEGLERKNDFASKTEAEVHYLFELVKLQFEFSREAARTHYRLGFESLAQKFLKNRKRNGSMLNLTEDLLITLTILVIGEQNQIKLNDLFTGLEERGVYLDSASRKQVIQFYEKLNLIEKKSDSGDSMYVKRIL